MVLVVAGAGASAAQSYRGKVVFFTIIPLILEFCSEEREWWGWER